MTYKNPLNRIKELVPVLPSKDAEIVRKYLDKRDFQSVLEIVESDLYKADKSMSKSDDIPDDYTTALTELRGELLTYMSYLDIPDNSNEYDY